MDKEKIEETIVEENDNHVKNKHCKKHDKEVNDLTKTIEQLKTDNHNMTIQIRDLKKDNTFYKASHEKVANIQKLQENLIRKEKDFATNLKYTNKNFILNILEPIEWFEKSLHAKDVPDVVKNWLRGFEMILVKFKTALEQEGVIEIIPKINEELDGKLHESIEEIESEENINSGKIAQVSRKGYKLHDRVIKYAQVKTKK